MSKLRDVFVIREAVDPRFERGLEDLSIALTASPYGKKKQATAAPTDPLDQFRAQFDGPDDEGSGAIDAARSEPDPVAKAWLTAAAFDTPFGKRWGRQASSHLKGAVLPPIPIATYARVAPASAKQLDRALGGSKGGRHVRQASDPWWHGVLDGQGAVYAVDGGRPQSSRRPDGSVEEGDDYPVPIMRAGGRWEVIHLPYEKKEKKPPAEKKKPASPPPIPKSAPYKGKKSFPPEGVDVDLADD